MNKSIIVIVVIAVLIGFVLWDRFDQDSVKGKRVFITGASTGIGEELAYQYAKLGANVFITARREKRLQEVVAKCKEISPTGQYYYGTADMSDMKSAHNVLKEAIKQLGGLDYLVLNHILLTPPGLWEGSVANFTLLDKIFDVNFHAYVHLASEAIPSLKQRSGSILVISSIAGKVGLPFTAPYSATKFALDGFFNGLRAELKSQNIDVSITVCPLGLIGTENAINNLLNFPGEGMLKMLKPNSVADSALAIIKGGALRQREAPFPYIENKILILTRDWIPDIIEKIVIYVWTGN